MHIKILEYEEDETKWQIYRFADTSIQKKNASKTEKLRK